MSQKSLRPDSVEIERSEDSITLVFMTDSGERQAVELRQVQIEALLARLAKESRPGSLVPIDRESLNIGQSISIQGWQVEKRGDGARRLVLHVDLPDQGRTVSIPLFLPPGEVADLIKELQ